MADPARRELLLHAVLTEPRVQHAEVHVIERLVLVVAGEHHALLTGPGIAVELETLRADRDTVGAESAASDQAIASVERQLATAERLKQQSAETVAALRLTQTQLDELVARASEVRIGSVDTDAYRRQVDDLVIRLEALHQAVEETRTA